MREHSDGPHSLLGQDSRWQGSAQVQGTLRVDGAFEGTLEVSKTLVIGKSGNLSGEIRARDVVVGGRVQGTIMATESVELQKGCHFEGDLRTRTFVVEAGVFFQGNCRMQDAAAPGSDPRAEVMLEVDPQTEEPLDVAQDGARPGKPRLAAVPNSY